jgi:hypothetical protein
MAQPAHARLVQWMRSPLGQRLLSVLSLVVVGVVQWKAVNVDSGPFKEPITVPAHTEVITFSSPEASDNGPFSFGYTPASISKRVLLEGYFENSELSPKTVQKFQVFDVSAPASRGLISYVTTGEGSSACATQVSVKPDADHPSSVSFSQSADHPAFGYRSLGVTFEQTGATVTLTSQGGEGGLSTCKVDLKVGEWEQTTQGDFSIEIAVPAGSQFRIHWNDLADESDDFTKQLPGQRLLDFGSNGTDAFTAKGVSVTTVGPDGRSANTPTFQAEASKGTTIALEAFRINSTQLEMTVDGNGVLTKDGKVVSSTNVLAAITKYPLLAAGFGALNIALINWVRRAFSPVRQQPATSDSAHA